VLQEVDAQQALESHRQAATPALGVVGPDQRAQIVPGQNCINLGQDPGPLVCFSNLARQRHLLIHLPPQSTGSARQRLANLD
jgi:hypothetical protein